MTVTDCYQVSLYVVFLQHVGIDAERRTSNDTDTDFIEHTCSSRAEYMNTTVCK